LLYAAADANRYDRKQGKLIGDILKKLTIGIGTGRAVHARSSITSFLSGFPISE